MALHPDHWERSRLLRYLAKKAEVTLPWPASNPVLHDLIRDGLVVKTGEFHEGRYLIAKLALSAEGIRALLKTPEEK